MLFRKKRPNIAAFGRFAGQDLLPEFVFAEKATGQASQAAQQMFDTAVCLAYTFVICVICPPGRFNPGYKTTADNGVLQCFEQDPAYETP
jgi:hypothetical protein